MDYARHSFPGSGRILRLRDPPLESHFDGSGLDQSLHSYQHDILRHEGIISMKSCYPKICPSLIDWTCSGSQWGGLVCALLECNCTSLPARSSASRLAAPGCLFNSAGAPEPRDGGPENIHFVFLLQISQTHPSARGGRTYRMHLSQTLNGIELESGLGAAIVGCCVSAGLCLWS